MHLSIGNKSLILQAAENCVNFWGLNDKLGIVTTRQVQSFWIAAGLLTFPNTWAASAQHLGLGIPKSGLTK